jgi:hypothetical protein
MLARPQIREHQSIHAFRNSAVRIGVIVGVGLSLVLSGWLYLANRVPIFNHVSVERNLAAATVLGFLAFIPVLRFFREPGNLLLAGLIAWSIFSLTYRALSLFFWTLSDWYSTFQVFMIGAVLYLIVATLAWLGACIWKARAAHVAPPRHRAS